MPKNTRLSGHTLRAEGKPYGWAVNGGRYVRIEGSQGVALCSCGTHSQKLHSDAERKRWHAIHKNQVRAQLASADQQVAMDNHP